MEGNKSKFRQVLPDAEREKIYLLAQKELFSPGGEEALVYLKEKRKFSEDTLKKMELGYMPKDISNCLGGHHELAGKIVIPIRDQHGSLIALSSRDWRKDAYMPFWHESFQKGRILYGLHLAKDSIIKNRKAIMVEGQFDVGTLWQSGLDFSVGILGSAPQLYQIALLCRYCREIFVVFDGDSAGRAAANRVSQIIKENRLDLFGLDIIFVYLPDDFDPDDFIKTKGKKDFIDILKEAKSKYYDGKK